MPSSSVSPAVLTAVTTDFPPASNPTGAPPAIAAAGPVPKPFRSRASISKLALRIRPRVRSSRIRPSESLAGRCRASAGPCGSDWPCRLGSLGSGCLRFDWSSSPATGDFQVVAALQLLFDDMVDVALRDLQLVLFEGRQYLLGVGRNERGARPDQRRRGPSVRPGDGVAARRRDIRDGIHVRLERASAGLAGIEQRPALRRRLVGGGHPIAAALEGKGQDRDRRSQVGRIESGGDSPRFEPSPEWAPPSDRAAPAPPGPARLLLRIAGAPPSDKAGTRRPLLTARAARSASASRPGLAPTGSGPSDFIATPACWTLWASSWAISARPASVRGAYRPGRRRGRRRRCRRGRRALGRCGRRGTSSWIRIRPKSRPKLRSISFRVVGSSGRPGLESRVPSRPSVRGRLRVAAGAGREDDSRLASTASARRCVRAPSAHRGERQLERAIVSGLAIFAATALRRSESPIGRPPSIASRRA